MLLAGAGAVATCLAWRLPASSLRRRWWLTAALLVYLALDDLLMIHEVLDQALHALVGRDPSAGFSDHLDDFIVAGYAGLFAALWLPERRALARLTWTLRTLAAGLVAYGAMILCDFAEVSKLIEDCLKIVGGMLMLTAFAAAYFETQPPALAGRESRRASYPTYT